jgi:hypothetical protein
MRAIRKRGIPKPRPTPSPTFRDAESEFELRFELFSRAVEPLPEGVGEVVLVELAKYIDEVGEIVLVELVEEIEEVGEIVLVELVEDTEDEVGENEAEGVDAVKVLATSSSVILK